MCHDRPTDWVFGSPTMANIEGWVLPKHHIITVRRAAGECAHDEASAQDTQTVRNVTMDIPGTKTR